MTWRNHKGKLVVAAIVGALFFGVHFEYVDRDDVRQGFQDTIGLIREFREFWHDVSMSEGEHKMLHAQVAKQKADARLNNHLDSLINKKKE